MALHRRFELGVELLQLSLERQRHTNFHADFLDRWYNFL
jgi:hypothetical protein